MDDAAPSEPQLDPYLRIYLLGLVSASLGDAEGAARFARELERARLSSRAGLLVRDLALGVRARAAWEEGETAHALGLLIRAHLAAPWEFAKDSPFHARTHERHLLALILRDRNQTEEALRWFGSPVDHSSFDVVLFAPSHLSQAHLHERLGARSEAARHYRHFLELWNEADPELQPMLVEAHRRLARLAEREDPLPR